MSLKNGFVAILLAVVAALAEGQEQPTPYDLIRPVWPLSWDSTVFTNRFVAGPKRNSLPDINTPAAYAPNEFIPDTLNQAFIDAMLVDISPIRVNQAGYRPQDVDKPVYYVGSATSFQVVNAAGDVVGQGAFSETLANSVSSSLTIRASNNAQITTGGDTRYTVSGTGPAGALKKGQLPEGLPENERLRIKVGDEYSSTFIISDRVYSMLRDAVLKFYGVNRSGNSESWFHKPSHLKDGSLANVDMTGGWYDCGDHLKESQTIAYSFVQLALMDAVYAERDQDNYAFNQSETQNTDGVPDILREARFGAEYVLKAYDAANGVISAMPVSVGSFGADHGWWGPPEAQDGTLHDRGGPTSRILRSDDHPDSDAELLSSAGGNFAAGLAMLAKRYSDTTSLISPDSAFAQKCLKVARELYEYGKSKKGNASTMAYSGATKFYDEMGLAAIALFYATGEKKYLNDAVEESSMASGQTKKDFANADKKGAGMFNGGWFAYQEASFLKGTAASDWASLFTSALYAFYKLILETREKAESYGLSDEQRMIYVEDVAFTMAANLGAVMSGGSQIILLPSGQASWVGATVTYDPVWGLTNSVNPEQWWTKYEASNIFELLAYYDVTKDLENVSMPQTGTFQDWKSEEILNLAVSHMNYFLGMNPWDVSLVYGVGDKNHSHPHHRGSNPEGKNVAGITDTYKYRPPVGGLGPAKHGSGMDDLTVHFDDYHLTENTCIDAVSNFLPATVILSKSEDLNRAPSMKVEIRHVSMDSAIVVVKLDLNGYAYIALDTADNVAQPTIVSSETLSNNHQIVLRDLLPGTTYYFYATSTNPRSGNTSKKWLVDSLQVPFSFTTLNMVENADIQNVTVCNLSADSAEIMWYTPNGEYESKVYWDTVPHTNPNEFAHNTGAGNADVSGVPTKFHYVKIGGLKERTTYYYAVESNGVYTNTDSSGNNMLKFTTPVMQYKFAVRMSQYVWSPMPALEINVINNEERPFDSLTLRLYMRGTDDIYYDVGIRRDICQAYNEAAFNLSCSPETQAELDGLFRLTFPKKIEDTYDPTDGTWQWYFPIPLGSTVIKSSSRMRIDVMFDRRSEWEPHLDLMNDTPKKRFYCNDNGTWESQAGDHLPQNPGDWSWMPHSKANGDYADFAGIPCLPKNFGDEDLAPINPYVSVYRKDEFVWGYSPSKSEMSTKKADYQLEVTLDAPFNVSNGSYVEIDQPSSTVFVKGHAHITEGGYITKIWANGTQLPLERVVVDNATYMGYNGMVVAQ
ncbi:MAG: glycoside hydrolase family 9 protein, partial [Fibrobacter sp.]|uniref:glycoside hydrolase family 9 protein n=1 Tax=Fibrobacter sp. TaxID=35828 RepID=UPI0025C317C9